MYVSMIAKSKNDVKSRKDPMSMKPHRVIFSVGDVSMITKPRGVSRGHPLRFDGGQDLRMWNVLR